MDPLSQGTVGAAFALSTANKNNLLKIGFIGFIAGLTPDLDVLIKSSTDPILSLEYHRQFTHSLFFIPFGSLFVALLAYPLFKKSMAFKTVYLACFFGYATHGLLDACTSYGTQLFWPFSNERVTWNNISIIDPLFTIPILILVLITIKTKKKLFNYFAIGWAIFYLTLGFIQYERALSSAKQLAYSRGHNVERLTLKPSIGNLILWKSIYQHDEYFYVDAIRTIWSSSWCLGNNVRVFDYELHLPDLDRESQQSKDIERFRWFSQDYLGYDNERKIVTDIRYSMIPNQIEPLWGLTIDSNRKKNEHAIWWTGRSLSETQIDLFKQMLSGRNCKKT